ncbi:Metal-dependent hydrolase, endonuclease/exonuclease/phosphatase family [Pedobacter steynii]|uniref:Metal-dependent hydrolase, endonuclease/exonuclease/phosphatase family n=1 Tax=Pedobacter steynii TaxID=430522 RepID=A0A1H0LAS5_9SPHI|nr:endonuclease/exonuclease/phosphatase family protein [Pedobacter steynii]NQX43460.1 endonuclease/exonuclease/phosphatase family protein [Pedobacter steynii]SDO65172.1 Metal-dependent hydrolase, endonuclease/exonuclease/phosphatase family [Pedobacter steynii]
MRKVIQLSLVLLLMVSMANAQRENAINIISYNIRLNVASDGENAWPKRKDNVKALVRFHDADILCVQEALPLQVDELLENTNYAMEGVGRDDGKRAGEFSAIYFDKSRFIKKDGGTFWLSETPEKPSKGWDAALNRVCSWVRLFDKKNKKEFLVFNTHYDHIGVQARIESAKLLKRKIQEIAPKLPVVFTGDLNVTPETEAIATIKSFLIDAKEASVEPAYGPVGTFNAFKFDSPLKDKIDYIFVNKGFKVQKFGVLSDSKDLRYPSDHLPIIARLSF